MTVLLDHNLPHKLRTSLGAMCEHEILTASHLGWGELTNGQLLLAAEEGGIDIFVTGDTTLSQEQNLALRRLRVIVLSTNNWPIIKQHVGRILSAIEDTSSGAFQVVDCGVFKRRRS